MLIKKHREQKCSFYSLNSKKASKIGFFSWKRSILKTRRTLRTKITPLSSVLLVFLVFFFILKNKK